MSMAVGFNLRRRVDRTVADAAARAGVLIEAVEDMDTLRQVSALFAVVWGRTAEGVPMHSESLRAVAHAGGLVNVARDRSGGDLLGAAVLGRDVPGSSYSYLAAVRPEITDRGIGVTLKQHQRAWALAHDIDLMRWTFDPLVARNARFNLVKLGAGVQEYEPAFYGQMADQLNGTDVGDRLVVTWELDSPRALRAGEGLAEDPTPPTATSPEVTHAEAGPDGEPALLHTPTGRWLRVPGDIVALRRSDPEQARAWRTATGAWFQDAFAAGLGAVSVSRTGWYHLRPTPTIPTTPDPSGTTQGDTQ